MGTVVLQCQKARVTPVKKPQPRDASPETSEKLTALMELWRVFTGEVTFFMVTADADDTPTFYVSPAIDREYADHMIMEFRQTLVELELILPGKRGA